MMSLHTSSIDRAAKSAVGPPRAFSTIPHDKAHKAQSADHVQRHELPNRPIAARTSVEHVHVMRKGTGLVLRYIILGNAVLGLVLASPQAKAAMDGKVSGYSVTYDRCITAAKAITSATLDCDGQEWNRQDVRLNAVYRRLMARLDRRQRAILRRSQRHWLATRRAECEEIAAPAGTGTLASVVESSCLLGNLVDRRSWLERYKPR